MEETPLEKVEFDRIADQLLRMDVFTSPSELHGLLCGLFSQGNVAFDEQGWLTSVATYLERDRIEELEVKGMLLELYAWTLQQLAGSGFDLCLVLPDDDVGLSLRAESLGRWCMGFLVGFGSKRGSDISEELSESLNDLQAIGDIQSDELDDDEESENDFMQVEEYIRMAVILAYSELNTHNNAEEKAENKPPLH